MTFDFVLLIFIGEATQQALLDPFRDIPDESNKGTSCTAFLNLKQRGR
jgi:hypothetical protein